MHKLEILLATLVYIEELEGRLARRGEDEPTTGPSSPSTIPDGAMREGSRHSANSDVSSFAALSPGLECTPLDVGAHPVRVAARESGVGLEGTGSTSADQVHDDDAARLLIAFHASPELRPVRF